MESIFYYGLPLRMEGDSNDEGTDNEQGWPTAVLDHGQVVQMEIEDHEEHQRCVTVQQ